MWCIRRNDGELYAGIKYPYGIRWEINQMVTFDKYQEAMDTQNHLSKEGYTCEVVQFEFKS